MAHTKNGTLHTLLLGSSLGPLPLCLIQDASKKPCNDEEPFPIALTPVGLPGCSTQNMVNPLFFVVNSLF